MKVVGSVRFAVLLSATCLLLHSEKSIAAPGSVPPGACLYALDPTAADAFQIAGAQSVYTACGVVSESSASSAFEMEGSETLYLENHAQVSVVGAAALTGQTYLYDTISSKDVSAVQTTSPGDPLSSLSPPTSGTIVGRSHTNYDMNSKPQNNTISPGIYCGGLTIGNTNGTTFTFSPGVYIMAGGGLTLNSQAKVSGTGVTFYNTSSTGWGCSGSSSYTPITISGQVNAMLSAPTTGAFEGILFFGNRTGCSTVGSCVDQINGGSTAILNGALYFKSDKIEITGSNASGYTMLVADKIYINGNSNFGENGSPFDDITVSVSPSTASLFASQTQQFTATVNNTANTAVSWTISPSSAGSINSSGLYTAPSSITAQQPVTVTATSQADNTKSGTATVTLMPPATPTITFTVPNKTYGVAPFAVSATSNSSGAITYSVVSGPATISGSTVTITGVGTVVLQASQAASGNYTAGTQTASFTVAAEAPTITFTVPNKTYGVAPFTVSATSNSAGAITYSMVSGPATISGTTVTITGVGTVVLEASQAASGNYAAGTQNASFTVAAEAPTITFTVPNQTYGVAPFAVSAISNSSGAITYSVVSGPATINGTTVTITGVGTVVLQASQAASGNYTAGTQNASFTVAAEAPTISFSVPNQTYGVAPFTVSVTSNSSGAITYSVVSGPATISGSTVTITGVGTVVLQTSQAASGNYTAGTQNTSFTVAAEAPTISFLVPNQTYGVAPFSVSATSNSSGAIIYSVVSGPATISGSTVTVTGVGTVVLQASEAASGNYTVGTQNASFTVAAEAQTITFTAPASPVTYGAAPITLSASASSGLAVTFSVVSGPGTVSGSTLTFTGPGTLVVAANQPGDADYSAAPQVTQSILVNPPVSITVTPSSATLTASQTQQFTATVTNTSNTTVNWTITPGGVGSINSSGLYTAPASITTQQTVTLTATSQASSSATATATVTLMPTTQCNNANGYRYLRTITIPHTNVPNTDQINFPFLFSVSDPLLATTANGGHVANPNGYDIIFTSDAAGQNPLNYEMEEYSPATGQVIAWVQIPDLSHTTDTTIYLFYGNSIITVSQQKPTSVWDPNYKAVWHVPNGTQLSLVDSTSNGNNGTDNGALAASGQIDGGMSTNGSTYATIGTPADLANLAQGNATFSAWVNAAVNPNGGVIMAKDDADISSGWTLGLDSSNDVDFSVIFNNANFELYSQQPIPSGQWTYVVVTMAGTSTQAVGTVYVNGVPSNSSIGGVAQTTDDSADILYLANATFGDAANQPLNGLTDEFRISNTIRSADWIATEYANQSSPATFYNFSGEGLAISPGSATLYESGTQQFTATALNSCVSGGITWSISPASTGSITQNGLYTAPSSLATEETVTVTAASQSGASARGTIILIPPVAVSVSPATATISNGGQQQQFTATVLYTGNTAVTWSLSPSGAGTVDQTGLYTAPGGIPSQQIVTITATSQFDPTKSGSARVTLAPASLPPPICATSSYSFMRPIVINHNLVPNTDQTSFPFLFNTTDPLFATTANGGHMTNLKAWDLTFTSDPAGQNPLNYELEEYDPVAGTVTAWIGIPSVSHTSDTVIYMFYGNSSITAPQQHPTTVWDSNYQTVFHMANAGLGTALDSTANGFNGTALGVVSTPGEIDGAAYISGYGGGQITSNYVQNAATAYTVEAWVNTTDQYFAALKSNQQTSNDHSLTLALDGYGGCGPGRGCGVLGHATNPIGELLFGDQGAGDFIGVESTTPVNDGNWHHVVGAFSAPSGASIAPSQFSIYVDGVPVSAPVSLSSGSDTSPLAAASDMYMIGTSNFWTGGAIDEFRVSTIARSPDWIATEYVNQSSPSTFYQLYPENPQSVVPSSATLYAAQSEQFTSLNACVAAVTWSMPAGSPGALSTGGLYTAPPSIATPQSITVTATSLSSGTTSGTATVSLLPAITIGVAPASITLLSGQTQQFTATVANASNSAVLWSLSSTGTGSIGSTGLFSAPAIIQQATTLIVTATLEANPSISASATVTLLPTVTISITPTTGLLAASQNLQFSATVFAPTLQCNSPSCVAWSISPASLGSITNGFFGGFYTAPANIAPGQTVTVTGTITVDGVTESSTATVTLIPNSPTIAVEPASVTLTGGQSEQYYASIANLTNNAVTWTMSPTGTGTLSAAGLYTAPPVLNSQQVITITATSQAEPSLTASAVLTLQPAQCAAKAYSYVRSIVIDHTKVPSTDQVNFPFYFAVTDPLLASTSNGGHMASPNGYDIEFSSDPSGQQILSYEIERYNPVTGQIAAWVQVPALSHMQETVIYMFYGNSTITGSQQNPAGVWESKYAAVYQFENLQAVGNFQSGTLLDTTANGNNATYNDVQNTSGQPGGAGIFDGATSYAVLPTSDFASFPYSSVSAPDFNATFGVWFKTSSSGVILGQVGSQVSAENPDSSSNPGVYTPALYVDNNGDLRATFFSLQNAQQIVSSTALNDNNWHHAVLTFDTNAVQNSVGIGGSVSSTTSGIETLYVDGSVVGSQTAAMPSGSYSAYSYYLGDGYVGPYGSRIGRLRMSPPVTMGGFTSMAYLMKSKFRPSRGQADGCRRSTTIRARRPRSSPSVQKPIQAAV